MVTPCPRPGRSSDGHLDVDRIAPGTVQAGRKPAGNEDGDHGRAWAVQRAQMKGVDPRIGQPFHRMREVIDILEQMMLHPYSTPTRDQSLQPKPDKSPPAPTLDPAKLAYTIKEICKLGKTTKSSKFRRETLCPNQGNGGPILSLSDRVRVRRQSSPLRAWLSPSRAV